MKTKVKQKIIVAILIITLSAATLLTVNFSTLFTKTSAASMAYPQITVLTHGLADFNGASHWSNTYPVTYTERIKNKDVESFHFCYDNDSLIAKLDRNADGADVYWAKMAKNVLSYDLYDLKDSNNYLYHDDYYEAWKNGLLKSTAINNVSRHIIIVFEASNGEATNDEVYEEFEYMLNDVIAQVKSHNPEHRNPKVNLIGQSRGGLTNLQYALDYPENVDSMISMGTPYFGSSAANSLGEIILGPSAGLDDINNRDIYNKYYEDWSKGYESRYKKINSIAIGSMATIDYLITALGNDGSITAIAFATLLQLLDNAIAQITISGLAPAAAALYAAATLAFPPLAEVFSLDQVVDLLTVLSAEIRVGTWYSDVMVPLHSQLGSSESMVGSDPGFLPSPSIPTKNYYFTKYVNKFEGTPKLKRNVNNLPIIHNIETYSYSSFIVKNIVLKNGDIPESYKNDIDMVGYIENDSFEKWSIKVRNNYSERREFAYNKKLCFESDAKNWTGLKDIGIFYLDPGDTKVIEIESNGTATTIAISSVSNNVRYIMYANELDQFYYYMTVGSSTKSIKNYYQHGITTRILGKDGNTWLIKLTNNTDSNQKFYYNSKMCYAGDAQNWTGLSDIKRTGTLASGDTTILSITENASATSIAISYISGSTRYIFYAYDLNADCTLSAFESSKPYHSYTKNGMTVSIAGKNGNTWLIELTNNTGSERTFYYNTKMCYAGDAENWKGLSDESNVYLANGATTSEPLQITENMTATSIAISYMDGIYRKIFYAYDLDKSGTMSAFESTIDTTATPDECVAAGTLITLADGTQKAVEDLTGDEMLLVWNLETGTYDSAPIVFVDRDAIGHYEVIDLAFSDGTSVDIIYQHGFWDVDLNEYVYLDENAAQYIGHRFNKQTVNADESFGWTEVTLTGVEISTEVTTAYSPVTYGHLCYYVNGMLSMPGGITGLFNIFEVDAETMTIDGAAMQADIAEYGLFTYEEFYELYPVSEDVFEAFGGRYLKVAMGKGMTTNQRIGELIERYSEFF